MSSLIIYLLKVSAGLAIISSGYLLFLRNDRGLLMKRAFLVSGVLIVWIFPLLNFRMAHFFHNSPHTLIPEQINQVQQAVIYDDILPVAASGADRALILLVVYLAGLFILLARDIAMVIKWNRAWKQFQLPGKNIVYTNSDRIFTLFTRIFLPRKLEGDPQLEMILLHEKAHVHQLHYIDLLLSELTLVITWFNPFSWLISRMIRENHEHLADREVLLKGINPIQYKAKLVNLSLGVNFFRLGHQFNNSLTKNRFKMMKNITTGNRGIIRYILVIPAVIISLMLFTSGNMQAQPKEIKGKVIFSDSGNPAYGTSVIINGTTTGTVADKNGEYSLDVEGDPEIIFSYIGYSSRSIKASELNGKTVKLDAMAYLIDPGFQTGKFVEKEGNAIIIKSKAGDTEGVSPVIVVDGKVVNDIEGIDPGQIESVAVFKDTDSEMVKKYDAKNGLIIVTTKKEIQPAKTSGAEVFIVVEEMPEFPGGKSAFNSYIYDNLVYPEKARKSKTEGEVFVAVTILENGKPDNIGIEKSSDPVFNEAALALFKDMPDWKPGRQRGTAVNVKLRIPVKFILE